MRIADKHELANDLRERYVGAGKAERGQLIASFCLTTKYHPKYAGALLRGQQERRPRAQRAPRRRKYAKSFDEALALLWEASGYICAERLTPWLTELARLLEKQDQLQIDEATRALLSSASINTVERRLHELRRKEVGRRMSQTKPGTLLRRQIPVIVGHWKELDEPGWIEIDLVSHSGELAVGKWINTLSAVDICTGWSERVPIMGKTQEAVEEALGRLEFLFPFEIKGLHPDNGSEFLNYLVLDWCRDHKVILSRGRPYRKNDNPHVEQKNWTLVRRHIGYERWDTRGQQLWLENFYTKLLRPFANCFQPTMKLVAKVQVNNHTRRKYDDAKTPLQRVIDSGVADQHKLARLRALYDSVSPLTLKRQIDRALAAMPITTEDQESA